MVEETSKRVMRLGESLLRGKLLNDNQMEFALQKQRVTGERLGELLVRLGLVSEYDLAKHLATQAEIEFIDVDLVHKPTAEVLRLFNQEYCLSREFLPIKKEGNELVVVIGNSSVTEVRQAVSQRAGMACQVLQGVFSKIPQAIRNNYFFIDNPVEELFLKEVSKIDKDIDQVRSPEKLINYLLHLSVLERATDIHIKPEFKSIHIFFRVDGVLQPVFAIPVTLKRLVAAIKRYAGMDVSDQLRPQDGSFSTEILATPFDIRVSTLISEYGENVVMRLLPSGMHVKGLNELGFDEKDLEILNDMFVHPHGILLMTGPTGSGKTTTLHAGLRSKEMIGKNILTVEDPIEYKLPTICQTQVNRKAGYDFSTAIRHFLRHDPDIMLVGEIRDPETADAAITAAETGHLVLSTLHVNTVLGVISRLQSLDVPLQMIADALVGVVNQRLARKICIHCKVDYQATDKEMVYFAKTSQELILSKGDGCSHCKETGYFGRTPLYEILYVDTELQEMIASNISRAELARKMRALNFKTIEKMALEQVLEGNISLEEVVRLLGSSLLQSQLA